MVDCAEMKEGDRFICESCGLELQVTKTCSCTTGEEGACSVPLQCCGKDMVKKQFLLTKKGGQGPMALLFCIPRLCLLPYLRILRRQKTTLCQIYSVQEMN